jgi:aminoglycoside phosphotransferase family enzyme
MRAFENMVWETTAICMSFFIPNNFPDSTEPHAFESMVSEQVTAQITDASQKAQMKQQTLRQNEGKIRDCQAQVRLQNLNPIAHHVPFKTLNHVPFKTLNHVPFKTAKV